MPGDVVVDLTKAITLEPLPAGGPYLASVSKFETGESKEGASKVHIELTVVEPTELARKKLFDDINLENEYTIGRLKTFLTAAGEDEKDLKKKLTLSDSFCEGMIGRQVAVFVKIDSSPTWRGMARISRVAKAEVFTA